MFDYCRRLAFGDRILESYHIAYRLQIDVLEVLVDDVGISVEYLLEGAPVFGQVRQDKGRGSDLSFSPAQSAVGQTDCFFKSVSTGLTQVTA
jgi:hypothetical protein